MPLPLIPLIAAGASLLGTAGNALSNANINRKNREFSQDMYDQQRKDALADYAMMNEYNSPAAQMERLKAGGLNPNLVYGQGATTTSANVRSSSPPGYHGNPNRYDFGNIAPSLMAQYEIELKKAQTDNVKQQTDVAKTDVLLKSAQIANTTAQTENTGVNTATGKFKLGQSQSLNDYVLAAAEADLKKTMAETTNIGATTTKIGAEINKVAADTRYTLDQNERQKALQAPTLALAVEKVLSERLSQTQTQEQVNAIKHGIVSAQNSAAMQELDIALKKLGIQPHDPAYMRVLTQILGSPQQFKQNVDKKAKEILDNLRNSMNYYPSQHRYGSSYSK